MAGPGQTETSNAPSKAGFDPAWIEKGTVFDVDLKNWTVDVVSEYSSKVWEKVQWATPYFHTANGEGIFAMPEPGAVCLVVDPSDDTTPYVLAFLGSFELEGAKTANLQDSAGAAKNETEETKASLKTPKSGISTGAGQSSTAASARGGRPYLNPGDIMMRTRDKNFIVLRRGGVLQLGTTPTCQSIYVPINNFLRQFAENYEVSTPGGMLHWAVQRQANDPGGEAPVLYRLVLRDKAQNDKADIQLKMGHVDDSVRYQLEVAPKNIKVPDGSVSSPKLKLTIDKDGNEKVDMKGSLEYTIAQNRKITVKGNDTIEVTAARSVKALSQTTDIKSTHTLKAALSTEDIKGVKTIRAATVMIGMAPLPTVIGPALIAWCAVHTHALPFTPPNEGSALPGAALAKTVLIGS